MYYAVVAAVALAAADLLIKAAAGRIPDSLGMLLYALTPFITGVAWVWMQRELISVSRLTLSGIACGLGVGVMFAVVTFAMYAAFRLGAPVSLASPAIRLGGLLVASIAGLVFWQEPFTVRYGAGLMMVLSGMYLMLTR